MFIESVNVGCNNDAHVLFTIGPVTETPIDRAIRWANELGMNQSQFAAAMGVTPQDVTNWKRRGMPPEHHALASVVVKHTIDELVGLSAAENAPPEYAGRPRTMRLTPVLGAAMLGENGYFDQIEQPDGWVDGYSADLDAYALRVKGDSMHPAIRHGTFVVVEPNGRCVPGEYVAIVLLDDRKMVKELVIERPDEVVVESVNGNQRQTIARSQIRQMHPVAAVVAASKWRPS